MKKNMPHNQTN